VTCLAFGIPNATFSHSRTCREFLLLIKRASQERGSENQDVARAAESDSERGSGEFRGRESARWRFGRLEEAQRRCDCLESELVTDAERLWRWSSLPSAIRDESDPVERLE